MHRFYYYYIFDMKTMLHYITIFPCSQWNSMKIFTFLLLHIFITNVSCKPAIMKFYQEILV